jgi:transposase
VRVVDVPVSIIFHDNARARPPDAVKDLVRRWRWQILEHPPYSPDMSICHYDLLAKMKEPLRETRYSTREETRYNTREETRYNTREETRYNTREETPYNTREETPYNTREETPYNTR